MKGSRVTAFAAGLLLVASCTGGSDDSDAEPTDTDSDGSACAAPPFTTPPDVDAASCQWLTDAEDVVGFHDILLATVEESRGQFRMLALDPATGDMLWQTDPLYVLTDDPDSSEPNDRDRSLEIVHWQGEPYASFEYVTQPEGVADPREAVTFVPLAAGATPTPVTWVSPGADTVVHTEHVQSDDVTLAMTEADATYQVIDPATGRTTVPLKTDPLEILQAVGDGWFAESFGTWGWTFLVRNYDGSVRWDARDHVPEGANRGGNRAVVGAYGEYVIALWDKPGPFSVDGPWLLVVHDADGDVVAQADYGTSESISQNRVVVSPNEQWMVVDSNDVGSRPVAVDLVDGIATSLPEPLAPLSVTDAGVVYGVEWPDASKTLSVVGTTGETLWSGPATSRVPSAVIGDVAVVSQTEPASLVGGQVYDDASDTQPRTAPAWALAADSAPVPEPTDEPTASDLAAQFAPLVYLAEGEEYGPGDAGEFIAASALMWAHDGPKIYRHCPDDVVDADPSETELAAPTYRHQPTSPKCDHEGQYFTNTEPTRPYEGDGPPDAEGYFLDADDDLHEVDGADAPVYVQYVEGKDENAGMKGYVYWFFYPWNQAVIKGGHHEADWERVSVVTDAEDNPLRMVYSQHNMKCYVDWSDLEFNQEHPVAYSASGSHGSYPLLGQYDIPEVPVDDQTSRGNEWYTWDDVREIAEQGWWGYAGGWGEVGAPGPFAKERTGPAGPRPEPIRDMGGEVFTTKPCLKPVLTQPFIDQEFLGTWRSSGPVDQPSSDTTYSVELTIDGVAVGSPVGEVSYPGLECSGRLLLRESYPDRIVLAEIITDDPRDTCADEVTLSLRLAEGGLDYAATIRGSSTDAATAHLVRR